MLPLLRRLLLAALVLSGSSLLAGAATCAGDTLQTERVVPTELPQAEKKEFSPSPRAAVLWSIIPGGGQVYNRKYWKLPIIVGGVTALYYAVSWNNNNLLEYAQAYADIKSSDPMTNDSWVAFVPAGADPESYRTNGSFQEMLRHGRDFYRRNRDLSIIISVGVYALAMIDAYVDAELAHFDISPDLTLRAAPAYLPPAVLPASSGGPVLCLALSF